MSNGSIDTTENYKVLLAELKARIRSARTNAAPSVNRQLILLYWHIGTDILTQQTEQGWGVKVIERLSDDLRAAYPDIEDIHTKNAELRTA